MNKKLIAAAIAAAVSAPAAMADVTVYGKIHMSIDSVDGDGAAYSGQAITSRASRIGFKGTEDLGNGLKAVWKYEASIATDTSSDLGNFGGRDAYLGLAGNFGTVLLAGAINTPFKNSTGPMDFFGDTLADQNSTVGTDDNRASNVIAYISPKFSGVQFSGAMIAGETAPSNDGLADAYSVALTYNNAGISAAVAYEDLDTLAGTDPKTKVRVGLGYKMDAFKVAGVYEKQSDIVVAGTDATAWQISAAYTMGNNTMKAMYGSYDKDGASELNSWAVGVDHKMSKRTAVYALYADSEKKLHAESSAVVGVAGNGFSLGMMHSF
jgi:predicted porin